jgi:hypothetical protein
MGELFSPVRSGQESDLMAIYSLTYIEMVAGASEMRLSSEHRATEHGTDVGLDPAGYLLNHPIQLWQGCLLFDKTNDCKLQLRLHDA